MGKVCLLLLLLTAVIAVLCQSPSTTTSTTKSSKSSVKAASNGTKASTTPKAMSSTTKTVSGSKTTSASTTTTTAGKSKPKAGVTVPPKGMSSQRTTPKTQTKNTTAPNKIRKPAKASENLYAKCTCQNDVGMDGFDVTRFVNRTWKIHRAHSVFPFNPCSGDCSTIAFSNMTKNIVKFKTSSLFSVSLLRSEGYMLFMGQGVFKFKFSNFSVNSPNYELKTQKRLKDDVKTPPVQSNLKLVIIDTNYIDFTIAYICGNYSIGPMRNITTGETAAPTAHMFHLLVDANSNMTKFNADQMSAIKSKIQSKYSCFLDMNIEPSHNRTGVCKRMYQ